VLYVQESWHKVLVKFFPALWEKLSVWSAKKGIISHLLERYKHVLDMIFHGTFDTVNFLHNIKTNCPDILCLVEQKSNKKKLKHKKI